MSCVPRSAVRLVWFEMNSWLGMVFCCPPPPPPNLTDLHMRVFSSTRCHSHLARSQGTWRMNNALVYTTLGVASKTLGAFAAWGGGGGGMWVYFARGAGAGHCHLCIL